MARGASRANASGAVEASGTNTTVLKVEGNFNVTGPLETFANAGGVHVARAILAEFAENAPKVRFAQDSPLEEAVSSEPVSESRNSLLAGKIQGILFVWASESGYWPGMQGQIQ